MDFCDSSSWEWYHYVSLGSLILGALELLVPLITVLFSGSSKIPIKANHLDHLEFIDKFYLVVNRFITVMFVHHLSRFLCWSKIPWKLSSMTISNTLLTLPLCFIAYDLFYTLFHHFLHFRFIYGFIHKHHHRQQSPTRGYIDASNVHPIEFILGEYLHLLIVFLLSWTHGITVIAFLLLGAVMASLNHTRYDVFLPVGVYSVKYHDIHHRLPEWNMGQYVLFWDRLLGSFRDYQ
uniref:C-5 sterol desaturase n=1 Tax=Hirondellea gigas TaxID=1518452 RepID=A0A6A7G722_9CRUS